MMYALEKALSDGSNYNLSCWFDFLYALGTRSIVWHCNISYCLKVKVLVLLLNRQHSLILNTLSGNDCTLHLKGQWTNTKKSVHLVNNWTWKKPICISKGRVRFDFSKHRGRSLEKHTPGKFSIGEDNLKNMSRTRDKNDLARSTDSNKMHCGPLLIKVSTISGCLYFKPFDSVASIYCSLDS